MTDPTIEAAHRALVSTGNSGVVWVAQAAAREALAPIRELHKPVGMYSEPGDFPDECDHCGLAWPCPTADLIYTTEDLT